MPDIDGAERIDGRRRDVLIPVLVTVDALALVLALSLTFYLRYRSGLWLRPSPLDSPGFLVFSGLAILAYLVVMALYDLYDQDYALAGRGQFKRLVGACTLALGTVVFLTFVMEEQLSRGAVLLTWFFSVVLLMVGRWALTRVVAWLRSRGRLTRRVLLVGADGATSALALRMAAGGGGMRLVGCLHDFRPVGAPLLEGIRVVGDPTRLDECVRRYAVDEVVVAPTAVTWESLQGVLEFASHHEWPRVRLLPGLYDALTTGVKVTYECSVPMMALEPLRIRGPEAAAKHVMDYAVALCFLPLVLAVVAVAWVMSLFDGAGSPLMTTAVQGRSGRPFGLLSLRRPGDHRRPGSWRGRIAASRAGKLPALLNVLRGDVSLVGPRAVPLTSGQCRRLLLSCVKPGLTGPWRFARGNGNGRGLPPEVEYVQDYSLLLDLRLLLGSFKRLLLGRAPVPLVGRPEAGPQTTAPRALLLREGMAEPTAGYGTPRESAAR